MKPIRFSDTWDHRRNMLPEGVAESAAIIRGDYAQHGKSYFSVACGFCNGDFIAYKWSLRGGGKRCPHCKALMGSNLQMYQWEKVSKND